MSTMMVTGAAGFIGSHMVDRLLGDGHEVVAVDDLSTGDARRVSAQADLQQIDIVNFDALSTLIRAVRPRAIFHLAAQSIVTVSVRDPWRDCDINVTGTLNVLQSAREVRAPVVFTSTGGALYGDQAPIPTTESWPPAPLAPYGASKWAAEAYVLTWALADRLPHTVCRLGNVYGPRQSPDGEAGVVAILSHRLWSGQPATLFGCGEPSRDYVHVRDVTDALRCASGKHGVFNVSTGREVTVNEIFELLRDEAGVESKPELAPLREGELERSCIDSSRAAAELGWEAAIPVERGVPETYRALVAEFEASGRSSS